MPNLSSLSSFNERVQNLLSTFSRLTNINAFFYSPQKVIIDRQQVLSEPRDIYKYLSKCHLFTSTIFPIVVNGSLSGFFVLNIDNIPKEQILMYQSYLNSTNQQLAWGIIHVLNALDIQEVKYYFSALRPINLVNNGKSNHRKNKQQFHTPLFTQNANSTVTLGTDNVKTNLNKALAYIDNNITRPLALKDVAQHVFLSPSYISRLFKSYFKVNFVDYVNIRKIAIARAQLLLTNTPINKLAHNLGFSQASYFTKMFKQKCNITPLAYRMQNPRIEKVYTITRDITWLNNQSVYSVSKQFFKNKGIKFTVNNNNGYPYIYAIDGLGNAIGQNENGGWLYDVNCHQPTIPSTGITVGDKSVIQWIYTQS
ncbi:helix-turn-helix domain-containing protein [Limosilactobacillus sp.]|jgi:two-component system response regulator YesN|uniref:helix-turn-helix domain-containing protein n=1 Tax=Limosilactobacillus sp. TaxID=2773925 RepID=UPI0035A13A99